MRKLESLFNLYGRFLVRHPLPFLVSVQVHLPKGVKSNNVLDSDTSLLDDPALTGWSAQFPQ